MQSIISGSKKRISKNKTLRESYEQRKSLVERVRRAEELLIAEQTANILLEALDKDELKQATEVLKKLGSIKKVADTDPELAPLGDAIKTASDEVNKFMGGGIGAFLKKGISKLASKFGAKAGANPILKSLMLLNSLESGLEDVPSLIKNNIPEYDEKSEKSPFEQAPDDKAKKSLAQAMTKAFRPEGVFSTIKSLFDSGGMPYVKNVDELIVGIMSSKPKSLEELIKIAKSGVSSEDAAAAVKDMAQPSTSGQQTSGKQQPVTSTDQLAQAYARGVATQKKQDPAAAAAEAEKDPKKFTQSFMADVEKKSGQKSAVVKAVITTLVKKKKLLGNLQVDHRIVKGESIQESKRSKNVVELTLEDVNGARRLFRESGGSSRRWAQLLVESESKGKWIAKIKDGEFSSADELKKAFKEKAGKAGGYPHLGQPNQEKLLSDFDKLKSSGTPKTAESPPKQDSTSDDDLKTAANELKEKGYDLATLKGRAEAIRFVKSKFELPDIARAKEFLEKKILPKMEKAGDEAGSGSPPNLEFLDNKKVAAGIDSAKSGEDLVKFMLKIVDSLSKKTKTESLVRQFDYRQILLEAMSDEEKANQVEKLKKTAELLKKIFADPNANQNLMFQLPKAGGLQDKVAELVKPGGGGENTNDPRTEISPVSSDALKALSKDVKEESIDSKEANKLLDDAINNAFEYIEKLVDDKGKKERPYQIAEKNYNEAKASKETNVKIKSLNNLNTISADLLKKAGKERLKAAVSYAQEYKAANEELLAQIEDAKKAKSISGKHAEFIKDVQEELEGIKPEAIEAVLDAIPEFMKVAA